MKIELTDQERNVLNEFLGRVTLQGKEVGAFNQIAAKVNTPIVEKKEEVKK